MSQAARASGKDNLPFSALGLFKVIKVTDGRGLLRRMDEYALWGAEVETGVESVVRDRIPAETRLTFRSEVIDLSASILE